MFADLALSDSSVVAFNEGILLGITRLNIFNANILFLGPLREFATDKLRSVITTNHSGFFFRHSSNCSMTRITRWAGNEKSASIASPSER